MKIVISKQVYRQLADQSEVAAVPCDCVTNGEADAECILCEGGGELYEMLMSAEDRAEIENNLRSQGVPLGKEGTH
jgi:hypothetical protein